MLLDNYKKQSPIVGVAGLGGGINSYIFLSSGEDYVISKSLRFDSSASSYLNRTPGSAGNRRTFTWSGWLKKTSTGSTYAMFGSGTGSNDLDALDFNGEQFRYTRSTSGSFKDVKTNAVHRDPSAWYHVVLAVDTTQSTSSNRVKLYVNGDLQTSLAASNYPSQNEDTFINSTEPQVIGRRSSHQDNYFDGYLADIHLVDGQQLAATDFGSTDDNGIWQPKKYSGAHGTNGFHLDFKDNSSNAALGYDAAGSNNWTVNNLIASATPINTAAATTGLIGSNVEITVPSSYNFVHVSSDTGSDPGNVAFLKVNFTALGLTAPATITFDSYQQGGGGWSVVGNGVFTDAGNTTSSFTSSGNTRSNTINIPAGATYFAIPGSWTSASGGALNNGIHNLVWAGTSVSYYDGSDGDCLPDSPSQNVADETDSGLGGEITSNYATYNPVRVGSGTKSNGNLTVTGSGQVPDVASIAPNSGKWYAEIKWDSGSYARVGLQDVNIPTSDFGNVNGQSYRYESNSGNVQPGGQTYSTYAAGDIIGVAFDCDAGKLWLAKNGTWQNSGNPAAGSGAVATNLVSGSHYAPANSSGSGSSVFTLNAGQRAFAYTAPTGFKALCTANLPDPTIADGSKYFDTKLFTGTGSTLALTMANSAMSPGFVWLKERSTTGDHELFDSVRGVHKYLESNSNNAESTSTTTLTSFDSNGFTLGSSSLVNDNNVTYAAWAWDAGSSTTTIAVGSLNSSVYDQSQNWTSGWISQATGNSGDTFDGIFGANGQGGSNYLVWSPTSAVSYSDALGGVEVYTSTNNAGYNNWAYKVNPTSTSYSSSAPSDLSSFISPYEINSGVQSGWTKISTGDGSLTSVGMWNKNASESGIYMNGLKVNGKILVDSGVTPPSVPSTASTVRANPTAGFSIVKYTYSSTATVGHGLNAQPQLVIQRPINSSGDWYVYTKVRGYDKAVYLNLTNAVGNTSTMNSVDPTSTVFTTNNWNAGDNLAYCFAPVEGYSAMGTYTGNGNADGIFIYTGFAPSWILFKRSDSTSDWSIYDTARDPHNVAGDKLEPNTTDAESAQGAVIDILSNGFKFRRNSLENGGNDVYIYMAFASHPFNSSRAR